MAYFKTILRLLKGQLSRLITLTLIIMVSIGFVSGIGEVKTKINEATNKFYAQENLMDLNIKKVSGFSTEDINFLINTYGQENVSFGFFNFDILCFFLYFILRLFKKFAQSVFMLINAPINF